MGVKFIFLRCLAVHMFLVLIFQRPTVSKSFISKAEDVTNDSEMGEITDEGEREGIFAEYDEELSAGSAKDPFPYEHNSFLKTYRRTCGLKQNTRLKIVSGQEAEPHSWPWIVGLYRARLVRENKTIGVGIQPLPFCGASLISSRYLITASHCVRNLTRGAKVEPKHKWVRPEHYLSHSIVAKLGDHSTLYEEETSEENLVQEVMHFHEGPFLLDNDISIIKLAKPITFNRGIQPVCIPPSTYELPAGAKCTAVGWGCTNKSTRSGSPILRENELTVMSLEVCRGFSQLVDDGQICAGGAHNTGGKGDSGGGLYCKLSPENEQWYLFGVTSIGTPTPGPTVFASVPPLSNWINKNVDE
nr:chymotrypsin-like protein [Hymenolepis microstoma]